MIKLKACVKCNGDVLVERDAYGWYEQCLQCGRLRDLAGPAETLGQAASSEGRTAVARAA
ncbi:MAG: hypothetical protein HYX92_01640 [Chloroflexi bacterium]|nr:hypothetical protein [Chloroflexota bacterium]